MEVEATIRLTLRSAARAAERRERPPTRPGRIQKVVACLAWAVTAVLACGITETTQDEAARSGRDLGPEFEEWVRQLPGILCAKDCPDKANLEIWYGSDCLETATLQFESYELELRRVFDRGNVSFDAARAQRCLDEWVASECGWRTQHQVLRDCDDVFAGKLPVGARCLSSVECVAGAYCHTDEECSGRCVAKLGEGDACTDSRDECKDGFACLDRRECGAPKDNGSSCWSNADCQSQLCYQDRCAEQFGYLAQDVDEPCYINRDCKLDLNCQGGTCQPAPELGEPCDPYLDQCIPELYCLESEDAEGVCVERTSIGGPCDENLECTTTLCVEGVCEKRVGVGDPCVTNDQCWGAYCLAGVCDLPPPSCL